MNKEQRPDASIAVVALGVLSVFSMEIFEQCDKACSNFIYFYPLFIFLAYAVSMHFFIKQPFATARLVVLGVFLGIILHLIIFPTTKEGFERNLAPFEVIFHTAIGAITCYITAFIWWAFSNNEEQNT